MNASHPAEGLVVGAYSRRMRVRLPDDHQVSARIKGKTLRPVCGDRVIAVPLEGESEWMITGVCERRNELARPDSRGRREVLAANLDLMIVMAAAEPTPDWFIVDRYVAAAENMQIDAAIAFNKTDLVANDEEYQAELQWYAECDYPVIYCSALKSSGIEDLATLMTAGTSIIVGQSGVGKSSIINGMAGNAKQKTEKISESTGEGKHTTVASVLIDLPTGGSVIDSPGVRDYAPAIETIDEAIRGFREINETGQQCRFANCRHQREPNCAVKKAVETGCIGERRYRSYRRLATLAKDLADRR
jgi:ribosome biogenesis GTPase